MCRDLHMLDTSHMKVSGDRVEPDEQMNNRQEPPSRYWQPFYSKWSCDQFNDVMLANKMTCFGHAASEVCLPKIA